MKHESGHSRRTHAPAGAKVDVMRQPSYTCPELKPFEGRLGAMDAYRLPSRTGAGLVYPRGVEPCKP